MTEPLLVAKSGKTGLALLPGLANRHGLIVIRGVLGSILGGSRRR